MRYLSQGVTCEPYVLGVSSIDAQQIMGYAHFLICTTNQDEITKYNPFSDKAWNMFNQLFIKKILCKYIKPRSGKFMLFYFELILP